jgi:predicted DNA-binding WGR domain protein
MARFYFLDLEIGLFGHTVLVRRWGRIGTYGRRREHWFDDPALAQLEMARLAALKTRRGYLPVAA